VTRLTVLEASDPRPQIRGVVDVAHPDDAARRRFGRRGGFDAAALVWTDGESVDAGGPSFRLEEHVGWLAPDAGDADPVDVVKQVSFLQKSASVDLDEFRTHYRHHVELARRHMPTLWQYVQYDVTGIDGPRAEPAVGIVAVSTLWFRTTDDFLNRYFASPEDQAAFQAEEGFLDLTKAFSFVVTSHPSCGPAARPGDA
jgi:EthD domain